MCIPGAAMPRNQSSSQLPRGGVREWQESKDPPSAKSLGAQRGPVLSAPEVKPTCFHIKPAPIVEQAQCSEKPVRAVGFSTVSNAAGPDHAGVRLGSRRDARAPSITGTSHGSECSASHFPMSCSPQLPFAFTPASVSHSLLHKAGAELMEAHTLGRMAQQANEPRPGGCSPVVPPTPGTVIGRDVSDLALIRRSSWSTKSFSQNDLPWLGPSAYSFSPSPSMERGSSIAGISIQSSHQFPAVSGPSLTKIALFDLGVRDGVGSLPRHVHDVVSLWCGAGFSPASDGNPEPEQGPLLLMMDAPDDDFDSLPFALEDCTEDGTPPDGSRNELPSPRGLGTSSSASMSTDAAVGALARMLQEAPPLRSGSAVNIPGPQLGPILADMETLRHQMMMFKSELGA